MAATETVTVLFTDMVEPTGLAERLGPDGAARHRRDHMARLGAAVAAAGGREIRNVGGGLMVAFDSAAAGVTCALDMQRRAGTGDAGTGGGALRVGLSAGDAEIDGHDYFGTPVVEAARLCDAAGGGEILATELVRLLAGDRGPHVYEARGPLALKGFDRPVPAVEIRPDPGAADAPPATGVDVPLPGLVALAAPHRFVGRQDEWDTLEAAWATAARGARQVVLVGGDAGAGKTRLVTEFARAVHRRGALVLFGMCSPDFSLPYRPFVEALDHVFATIDPATGRALVGAGAGGGAGEMAKLLPHLGSRAGAPAETGGSAGDSDAERYRLHEAVTGTIGALGRHRPLLLVVDDLHWADRPTVQLLGALLRSPSLARVCLVGTYRNAPADVGAPFREALPDLHRLPGVHRVRLRGFDRTGVEQYLAALADQDIDEQLGPLVDALATSTDGNAFLISELWQHLVARERVAPVRGRWRVTGRLDDIESPEGVRSVVGQRLAGLPAATRELLEVASVLGSTFDIERVAASRGLDAGATLEALEPALDSRFVEEAGPGTLRFAHALVRQSIEDSLAASARRRLHLQVAEALAAGGTDAGLDQIAHHYLAAVPLASSVETVSVARRAARHALGSVAYEHAVELLEAALPLAGGPDRAELLLDLAEARMKAGDTLASLDASAQAARLARGHRDGDTLVRAATTFEEATWRGAHFGADAERLVREALPHATDETTAARLLACRSRALAFTGRDDDALACAEEAIAFARRLGDEQVLCDALLSVLMTRWTPESATRQEECAREAAVTAAGVGDVESQLYATNKLLIAPMLRGDLAGARQVLAEHQPLTKRVGQPLFLLLDAQVRSTVALCEGRLEDAEAHAEEAGEFAHLLPRAGGGYGVQLFEIRRQQGRLDEARPLVEAVARLGREGATWRAGLAALYAELGMLDEAADLLPDLVADDLAAVPRDSLWCGALSYLADAAVATGDREAAATLHRAILPYQGYALITPSLSCHGAADRYLGALAAVLGRRRDARAHLEAAVAVDDGGGARTWAAHSRYELGRLLAGERGSGDVARARTLLDEAAAAAVDIGIPRLAERCQRELAALNALPVPSPADPVDLTGREVAVLRLLADGCTNRQAGAELNISQHTVANHVRAILLKTGCRNRTEAASWALRHGVATERATPPP